MDRLKAISAVLEIVRRICTVKHLRNGQWAEYWYQDSMSDLPIMLPKLCGEKAVSKAMSEFSKSASRVLGKTLFITQLVEKFEILERMSLVPCDKGKEHILEHTT